MAARSRLWAVALLWGLLVGQASSSEPGPIAEPPLRIGAFNVQVFGTTKMAKPLVQEYLPKIVLRYDILLVQEIRDASGTAITDLLTRVNKLAGSSDTYAMEMSKRLGRSTSKEQYAFLYRTARVTATGSYQYPDTSDYFQRPPFTVRFSAPSQRVSDFAVIGIHTAPSDAVSEIDHLTDVYEQVVQQMSLTNILIAGDFNADCTYVSSDDNTKIRLRTDSHFKWLIGDNVDSTVSATDCSYDRLVTTGTLSNEDNIVTGSLGIFDFKAKYGLSIDEAKTLSDHYPIEMSLKGKSFVGVQRAVATDVSFTVRGKAAVATSSYAMRPLYAAKKTHILQQAGFRVDVHGMRTDSYYKQLSVHVINDATPDVISALQSLRNIFALDAQYISNEMMSMAKAYLEAGNPQAGSVYGLLSKTPQAHAVELICRLKSPYTCKVKVTKNAS